MESASPSDDVREIAADALIFAYPMLAMYREMVSQAIDEESPAYIGGFNIIRHSTEPVTAEHRETAHPNIDTLVSQAWLDLRGDAMVISVPAVAHDRYYMLQVNDLFTNIAGVVGVRATGFGEGSYLIVGPDWEEDVPEGINGVLRVDTAFASLVGRTLLDGPEGTQALEAVQSRYRLEPLSQFLARIPPAAPPEVDWLPWDDEALTTSAFIPYLNMLLSFCQPLRPADESRLQRFARIGIEPGREVDLAALDPATREAIDAGVADGLAAIEAAAAGIESANGLYGSHETLGDDPPRRAVGARIGLFGPPVEEIWYGIWETGSDGAPLDGGQRYTLAFAGEALPPAEFLWSITAYSLPDRALVANPGDRYEISDRTPGVEHDAHGGLTITISPEPPEGGQTSNWLPVPAGPFMVILRIYGPRPSVLDGSWQLPEMQVAS